MCTDNNITIPNKVTTTFSKSVEKTHNYQSGYLSSMTYANSISVFALVAVLYMNADTIEFRTMMHQEYNISENLCM